MYQLIREQMIPLGRPQVFRFFERPENLTRITPPWMGFRIVTPSPIVMAEGLEIDYTIRLLRLRVRWRSRITRYDPPNSFTDEQVRGPYLVWRHTHRFLEQGGKTMVIDEVDYALPGGPLGRLAHYFYVRRSLENIFAYREKALLPLLIPIP